ncbi:MAG: hypothetical protein R2681_01425 [Pyrinomonadaceae bacterium]
MKKFKLFACIVSAAGKEELISVAKDFSAKIEIIDGGVLFDISGLENLIGDQNKIAKRISTSLYKKNINANLGISADAETAILFAGNLQGVTTDTGHEIKQMFIETLGLDADIQNVFSAMGIESIEQLKNIPENDLIARYGQDFRSVIDLIGQQGRRTLVPNIKAQYVEWKFELEHSVKELERLVFIISSGVSEVLSETVQHSLSTEHMTIEFTFESQQTKSYEVKISFPTIQKNFWRKIIDHRISQDLPQEHITAVKLICHFTKPRSAQFGLYSAAKPEPESLHLTVNKVKKLVGDGNVGVPVLLDQRLQKPFLLDSGLEPSGIESNERADIKPQIIFNYFEPPIPAFVWVENRKLKYLKTKYFEGKVKEHGGIWRANSHWWAGFWSVEEWDVEVENHGVFRLSRKEREWFVTGEYD